MTRAQRWLLVALAAQVALIVLLRAPFGGPAGPREPQPLLPGVGDASPARIEIRGEEGAELTLVRDGDGDGDGDGQGEGWTIPELDGYPADAGRVEELLETLAGFRVRRPVVASGRYLETFRVADDDFVGRLRLLDGDGEATADLLFGTSPAYRTVHARRAGDDAVYEVRDFATHELRADAAVWIDKQLLRIPVEDVVRVTVERPDRTFELARGEEGWTVAVDGAAPVRADPDTATRVVETAADLRIAEAAGARDDAAMGLDAPVVRVAIERADGSAAVVRLGAEVPDSEGRRHVAVDGSPFAGIVWDSTMAPLMTLPPEELVADDPDADAGADTGSDG